jgi:ATP-dependent Clp protease ATP-binding subunit ClpC
LKKLKVEKNRVVRSQKYEEAAKLRDTERQLLEDLEKQKRFGKKKPKITDKLFLKTMWPKWLL